MSVCVFQNLAQRNEWLYITSRSNDLDDDIERWWRSLTWFTTERRGKVWRGSRLFVLNLELVPERRCQKTAQSTSPLVDVDVYTSIVCNAGFGVDSKS